MHTSFQVDQYPVFIGSLSELRLEASFFEAYSTVMVLSDQHTQANCLPYLLEHALPDMPVHQYCIAPGESQKTMQTCEAIWAAMFEYKLDRKSLLINLGGGVIGDMGGFCAATYKRGIDFIQVPTTLLSATDAAVGGKLGIDFQGIKNAIGIFKNPTAVWIDPYFFQTLSQRELYSGFAEVIKHALIGSPERWKNLQQLHSLSGVQWTSLLADSIGVKIKVVREDPLERGLRAVLNYGHTIGHALESYYLSSPKPITHGEAVAYGMLLETYIHAQQSTDRIAGILPDLIVLIQRFYPYVAATPDMTEALWVLMQQDKKNEAGSVKMGLPGEQACSLQNLILQKEALKGALDWWSGMSW